jgi:hypothetical protein
LAIIIDRVAYAIDAEAVAWRDCLCGGVDGMLEIAWGMIPRRTRSSGGGWQDCRGGRQRKRPPIGGLSLFFTLYI